jgi:hypothetical protein
VPAVADCPYASLPTGPGIRLVTMVDPNGVPEQNPFPLDTFVAFKQAHAASAALDPFVHYNLWLHTFAIKGVTQGNTGNTFVSDDYQDCVISLGSNRTWTPRGRTSCTSSGTALTSITAAATP